MSENYIVINGKKAELTEDQLKQLCIETEIKRNNPFDRRTDQIYCFINPQGTIINDKDKGCTFDFCRYRITNYFNDRDFAKQVMLHQQLYRKLLKYAYDNNAEVTQEDWKDHNKKFFICYESEPFQGHFTVDGSFRCQSGLEVYFKSSAVATNAIRDIIEPFMKEYPEFVW